MSKQLKIKFDDQLLTEVQLIEEVAKKAEGYGPEVKKFLIDATTDALHIHHEKQIQQLEIEKMQQNTNNQSKKSLPWLGLGLLLVIIVITLINPFPSDFQSGVWWVTMSLGAAFCAAVIPGFFEIKYKTAIRATGAIGVFIFMYLYVPKIMSRNAEGGQSKVTLFVVNDKNKSLDKIVADFNRNSSAPFCAVVAKTMGDYWGTKPDLRKITIYNSSDGKIYDDNESCKEITDFSVLVIPDSVVSRFPSKREAFLKYKAMIAK